MSYFYNILNSISYHVRCIRYIIFSFLVSLYLSNTRRSIHSCAVGLKNGFKLIIFFKSVTRSLDVSKLLLTIEQAYWKFDTWFNGYLFWFWVSSYFLLLSSIFLIYYIVWSHNKKLMSFSVYSPRPRKITFI